MISAEELDISDDTFLRKLEGELDTQFKNNHGQYPWEDAIIDYDLSFETRDRLARRYSYAGWNFVYHKTSKENGERAGLTHFMLSVTELDKKCSKGFHCVFNGSVKKICDTHWLNISMGISGLKVSFPPHILIKLLSSIDNDNIKKICDIITTSIPQQPPIIICLTYNNDKNVINGFLHAGTILTEHLINKYNNDDGNVIAIIKEDNQQNQMRRFETSLAGGLAFIQKLCLLTKSTLADSISDQFKDIKSYLNDIWIG